MKNKCDLLTDEFYAFYKKTYSETVTDRRTYSAILNKFFLKVLNNIYNNRTYKLPENFGEICVTKKKITHIFDTEGNYDYKVSIARTNWGETNKLWKKHPELAHKKYIVYENEHTNGYSFKIYWNRLGRKLHTLGLYGFRPARTFSRNLAKFVKQNPHIDYYIKD